MDHTSTSTSTTVRSISDPSSCDAPLNVPTTIRQPSAISGNLVIRNQTTKPSGINNSFNPKYDVASVKAVNTTVIIIVTLDARICARLATSAEGWVCFSVRDMASLGELGACRLSFGSLHFPAAPARRICPPGHRRLQPRSLGRPERSGDRRWKRTRARLRPERRWCDPRRSSRPLCRECADLV